MTHIFVLHLIDKKIRAALIFLLIHLSNYSYKMARLVIEKCRRCCFKPKSLKSVLTSDNDKVLYYETWMIQINRSKCYINHQLRISFIYFFRLQLATTVVFV